MTKMCNYCGVAGHTGDKCSLRTKMGKTSPKDSDLFGLSKNVDACLTIEVLTEENSLLAADIESDVWVEDSGASCHLSGSKEGMMDYQVCVDNSQVKTADGNLTPIDGFGNLSILYKDDAGVVCPLVLKKVAYVKGLPTSLFSLTKAISNGGKLISDEKGDISIVLRNNTLTFREKLNHFMDM